MTQPTPNVPMLRKIWDILQFEPEAHYQGAWRISLDHFQRPSYDEIQNQYHLLFKKIKQQKGLQAARCATTMCVAGLAADLDGGKWFNQIPDRESGHYLLPEPGEQPFIPAPVYGPSGALVTTIPAVTAAQRARRVLGLTGAQADTLFNGVNSKMAIKRIIEDIIGEPLN